MLQVVQDGRRDVTAKIVEHTLEHEVLEYSKISDTVKDHVKVVTQ